MAFKQFPEFTKLSVTDKNEYESFLKGLPPLEDISFASLMLWWGLTDDVEVTVLNDNLVISYCLHGDDKNTGLSVVGNNKLDETICTLLDYSREKGDKAKLIHVPDFVIEGLQYPELFNFEPEREADEYVLALSKFYPLENAPIFQRRKAIRFMERAKDSRIQVRPLDLSQKQNQLALAHLVSSWPVKGFNDICQREQDAFEAAIKEGHEVGLHNVCLSIDDEIQAVLFFQAPENQKYVSLQYIRLSYAMPNLFSFATHIFAEWFAEQGVEYVNLGMDYGRPLLRLAKLSLRPNHFFRKYSLEPQVNGSLVDVHA